jgi:hypothetical protein
MPDAICCGAKPNLQATGGRAGHARGGGIAASLELAVAPHVSVGVQKEFVAMVRKYSKSASKDVERAMHKKKRGTLKSGSGKTVKSRKQAIAIGLSEARKKGKKVPKKKAS